MHVHSRRGFLARTLGASWAAASLIEQSVLRAAQARAQARASSQPILFDLEKMAEGVYAALAKPQALLNCNAVIFENAADILIVDAHSKSSAVAALTAQIRKELTPKPIRYVVNTHFHWDHTQGNPTYRKFAPNADILASTATRNLIADLGSARLKASVEQASASLDGYRRSLGAAKTAQEKAYYQEMISQTTAYVAEMKNYAPELPNITFDRELVLHDKAHELHLAFRGRGHTAGDVVVFCPQKKVMATGDLLHGFMPYIFDAYPRDWPKTLKSLIDLPFEQAVGGHGAIQQGRDRLNQMAAYIAELTEMVESGKRQGRTVEELQTSIDPAGIKSLRGTYRVYLESQIKRFDITSAVVPPAQAVDAGVKTNIQEIYTSLDRAYARNRTGDVETQPAVAAIGA
jgi:cyclase